MKKQLTSFALIIVLCVFGTAYGQTTDSLMIIKNKSATLFFRSNDFGKAAYISPDSVLHVIDSLEAGKFLLKHFANTSAENIKLYETIINLEAKNRHLRQSMDKILILIKQMKPPKLTNR